MIENDTQKFLDMRLLLSINFLDLRLCHKYLKPLSEQYAYFIKVFGNVISLKELPLEQGLSVCEIFQLFIRYSLYNLYLLCPLMI